MKVIQVSSGVVKIPPEKGGAVEEHIVKLSLNLKNYCDVKIVDRMYSSGNIYRIDGVDILRIKVSFIYLHSRINHIINEFLYSKKLSTNIFKDADIIHAHNVYVATSALKIARKVGAKFVYTCHNGMWCSDKVNLYEKYLIRRLESKIMREADVSIAVSQNLKENIIQKGNVPEEKLVVVYNGVDTNFFNPNIDCSDILTKYNLEDSFVVLFVGRVAPAKGLEYLIKAANLLKDQPIKFLIVGPFKYMFHEGNSTSNYAKLLLILVRRYDL
ncbi:TPA: glycosyltransferase, partial [Candidatus Geothermarchaeota archaeon]|nr:glycosyltransferase [Candidatus Geothermarchaeota archaeon]